MKVRDWSAIKSNSGLEGTVWKQSWKHKTRGSSRTSKYTVIKDEQYIEGLTKGEKLLYSLI